MARVPATFLAFITGLATFLFLDWIGYNGLYGSLVGLLGPGAISGPIIPMLSGLIAVLVAFWLRRLLTGRLSRSSARCLAVLYLAALFSVLLLKSPGVQEVNLDLSDVVAQLRDHPWALFLNAILFVPVGAFLAYRKRTLGTSLLVIGVASASIEILQYLFALGISDVVDLCANIVGGIAGYLMAAALDASGIRILPTSDMRVGLTRTGTRHGLTRCEKAAAAALAAILASAASLALFAPTAPTDLFAAKVYDAETLAWMEADHEPTIMTPLSSPAQENVVTGVLLQVQPWSSNAGDRFCGLTVAHDSGSMGGLCTVAVPVVANEDTQVLVGGNETDFEALANTWETEGPHETRVVVVSHGTWLEATRVSLGAPVTPDAQSPGATFPWACYGDLLEATPPDNACLAPDGHGRLVLDGYVFCTALREVDGWESYATLACPQLYGHLPILWSVNASCV